MNENASTSTKRIMVVLAQYPDEELARRKAAVIAAAPPGADVGFMQMDGNVYVKGLTHLHRAIVAPLVARLAVRAEAEGYDAVVPYGTLDLGVEESRHVVDIPVLGPGQTGSHTAALLGRRIAVLCYDQPHVIMFQRLLRQWGVEGSIATILPVGIPVTEMASRLDDLRSSFVETARRAVSRHGADVILPLGMTMVPVLMSAAHLSADCGLPVVDPVAATLSLAATLSRGAVTNSRVAYPAVDFP